MKRLKLRKWVLVVLAFIIFLIFLISLRCIYERYNKLFNECDSEKGYSCSYYEMRQYSLGK